MIYSDYIWHGHQAEVFIKTRSHIEYKWGPSRVFKANWLMINLNSLFRSEPLLPNKWDSYVGSESPQPNSWTNSKSFFWRKKKIYLLTPRSFTSKWELNDPLSRSEYEPGFSIFYWECQAFCLHATHIKHMDSTLIDNTEYLHCSTSEIVQPRIYCSPAFAKSPFDIFKRV